MSILTSLTLPLAASTWRSSIGPSVLHGPHQVAQKSTITGCSREASITSLAKVASAPSLIKSPGPAVSVSPMSDIGPSSRFKPVQHGTGGLLLQRRSWPSRSARELGEIDDDRLAPEAGEEA